MALLISILSIASLALFFGLFFGLNYPEIKRHEWHLTYCTVLSADLLSRYCCEAVCSACGWAPAGSPQCGPLITQINQNYSPSACLANSTDCPTGVGSVCDGGYDCCGSCCSSCTTCSTSCSGGTLSSGCTTSCSSYPCDCDCCATTLHENCVLSCPICYSVNLDVTYRTWGGNLQNTTYTQDFHQNHGGAGTFMDKHQVNTISTCYYNPNNLSQVLFDVSFTPWKWAITAVFGMAPLAAGILFLAFTRIIRPSYMLGIKYWHQRRERFGREAVTTDYEIKTDGRILVEGVGGY